MHFSFQIIADVRKRFAGDRQNLPVSDINHIQLRRNVPWIVCRIAKR